MARKDSTQPQTPPKAPTPARPRKKRRTHAAALRERFEQFLPRLIHYLHRAFRRRPPHDYDDAMQEALAAAWKSFVRLDQRGIDGAAFVSQLARYAILHVRNGRRVAGGVSYADVYCYHA